MPPQGRSGLPQSGCLSAGREDYSDADLDAADRVMNSFTATL
ncbi:hypothetical protein [Rhodococcus sovatensis]|uniref:Uncharacterized protein n=1 Tax=Rhodococcus sovatensis TaxID=1805840 RepID=A0ABZ2PDH3_9NOCA